MRKKDDSWDYLSIGLTSTSHCELLESEHVWHEAPLPGRVAFLEVLYATSIYPTVKAVLVLGPLEISYAAQRKAAGI
jgi:hypothetical protein